VSPYGLTDVSGIAQFGQKHPNKRTSRPRRKRIVGLGDRQQGVTELIAFDGAVASALRRYKFGAIMICHGRFSSRLSCHSRAAVCSSAGAISPADNPRSFAPTRTGLNSGLKMSENQRSQIAHPYLGCSWA